MPTRPRTLGAKPRLSLADRRKEEEARRRASKPWRNWYSSAIWKAIRATQLALEPLCRRCSKRGLIEAATVCNHVTPHRGNWTLFVGGPFESVCKACHDGEVQREERSAGRKVPVRPAPRGVVESP